MITAYSYIRFSSPEQARGDSLRRQTEDRERWLAAHPDVTLDTSLRMTDAGRSGFKRKNWDTYALAEFVAHIKAGRVVSGSYLLVENLDRLSREDAGEATELFLGIVNKGITIVQLAPAVMEFRKPVQMMNLMFAIVELSRGHSESAMKSERCGKAWAQKQKDAGTKIVGKRLPTWIKYESGNLVLDKAKAAVVRRIYKMAINGNGAMTIAKTLNAENVPVLGRTVMKGRTVAWRNVTISHILTSRAAVGEYIPYNANRHKYHKTPGTPVPGYFPVVVDEHTWYAAQASIKTRAAVGRGRRGKHVNLLAGLLVDARDGSRMTYRHQKSYATIINVNAMHGHGAGWVQMPANELETAVLAGLTELSAGDIVGEDDDATNKVTILTAKKGDTEKLIKAWSAKMDNPDTVDIVSEKLGQYNAQLRQINADLAEAQREASSPVAVALGGLKSLAKLIAEDNSDEMRLKVRAGIRRIVSEISVLIRPGGRGKNDQTRTASVRVQFHGSTRHRTYLLWTDKRGLTSVAIPGTGTMNEIDIRTPKGAETATKILNGGSERLLKVLEGMGIKFK